MTGWQGQRATWVCVVVCPLGLSSDALRSESVDRPSGQTDTQRILPYPPGRKASVYTGAELEDRVCLNELLQLPRSACQLGCSLLVELALSASAGFLQNGESIAPVRIRGRVCSPAKSPYACMSMCFRARGIPVGADRRVVGVERRVPIARPSVA